MNKLHKEGLLDNEYFSQNIATFRGKIGQMRVGYFHDALSSQLHQDPRVITLDKNPAYPPAIQELINEKASPKETLIRQSKYLNNIVEQDHRFIKKITKPMLGFKSFLTAEQTLKGIEAMHMIRKGQAEYNSSVLSAVEWLNKIFAIVA
jgi:IS6 family transposase